MLARSFVLSLAVASGFMLLLHDEEYRTFVQLVCSSSLLLKNALTTIIRKDVMMGRRLFCQVRLSVLYYLSSVSLAGLSLVIIDFDPFLWMFVQRYVKYFERILTYFNGENQPGRRYGSLHWQCPGIILCLCYSNGSPVTSRCMLRGFRLHRCPYWIRPHITVSNHNGMMLLTEH